MMKWTRYLLSPVVIIMTILVITVFVFYVLYNETQKNCLDELNLSFTSAVHQEKEIRLNRGHLNFSHSNSDTSEHQIVVQQENETTVLEKPDVVKKMTFDEKQNHADQSYLFYKKRHISLHILDSIFRVELSRYNIFARTAVVYTDQINHATYYSSADSLFYASAWRTPLLTLGIRSEITLQGFARLSLFNVIRKDPKRFAIVFMAWAIITGVFLFFTLQNKNTTTGQSIENQSQIIVLDADKLLIVYRSSEIKLTEQLFQLFEFLWNQPGHYACYQELAHLLFEDSGVVKMGNRRAQAFRRLRKELQDIPELEIENIPQKGYRILLCESESDMMKNRSCSKNLMFNPSLQGVAKQVSDSVSAVLRTIVSKRPH